MSNILKFKNYKNTNFEYCFPKDYSIINELYVNLLNSGYTTCHAFHEAMRLLILINPHIKLSEISKKTFNIIYPIYDNYYENNIDNCSQS